MKFLQSKIIIGGICIILSGVFAFGVLPNMYKEKGGTQKVIKSNITLSAGTKIDESMLQEVEVGSFGLPKSIVKNKADIIGKYSKTTITPDDLILDTKLSDSVVNEKLERVFIEGKKLITITLPSIASGVGNHLKSGDIVSFVSYEEKTPVIYDELRNIEIYSIENDNARDIETISVDEDESDMIAATITVVVNDVQAQKLVNAEYSGKLHVLLEKRGQ